MVTHFQILGMRTGTSLRAIILPLSLDGLQDSTLSHLKAFSRAVPYAGDDARPSKLSAVQSLAWVAWFLYDQAFCTGSRQPRTLKLIHFFSVWREVGRAATDLWPRLCHRGGGVGAGKGCITGSTSSRWCIIWPLVTCQGCTAECCPSLWAECYWKPHHMGSAGLGLEWYVYFLPWVLERMCSPQNPSRLSLTLPVIIPERDRSFRALRNMM